jgi:hypothetical protein
MKDFRRLIQANPNRNFKSETRYDEPRRPDVACQPDNLG